MSKNKPRRKLAAILAADVVGFSKMMGENEDRTLENLKACRVITDESITTNHGRIFGSAGDSIIAEFASPVDAVIAATDFQRSLKLRNEEVLEEKKDIVFIDYELLPPFTSECPTFSNNYISTTSVYEEWNSSASNFTINNLLNS